VIDLTGKLSLVELAALIAECRIILGVDSMAMHLASMLGKPQIALFGPTNPYHWRPRHPKALVVIPNEREPVELFQSHAKKRDMKQLSTESVENAMERLLS
jgi:ADP-heptose:LPS heptosyltransferase